MLAVRRSGVSIAMQGLAAAGVIVYPRKRIHIEDRNALEKLASRYYGVPEAEFRRLLPPLH
jgi:hypothetical protein